MSYQQFQQQCVDCAKRWNAAFGVVGTTQIATPPTKCPYCGSENLMKVADDWDIRPEVVISQGDAIVGVEKALDYNMARLGETTDEYFGLSKRIVDLVKERNDFEKAAADLAECLRAWYFDGDGDPKLRSQTQAAITQYKALKACEGEQMRDLGKLKIVVTKTADGQHDYVQILSADQFSLNIVLIGEIEVSDKRENK